MKYLFTLIFPLLLVAGSDPTAENISLSPEPAATNTGGLDNETARINSSFNMETIKSTTAMRLN